jgi:hypothetical protein
VQDEQLFSGFGWFRLSLSVGENEDAPSVGKIIHAYPDPISGMVSPDRVSGEQLRGFEKIISFRVHRTAGNLVNCLPV